MQLRQVQGRIQTLGADLTTLSTPVDVTDPAVIYRVVGQVKSWAKYFNVLSIRNAGAGIDLQFALKGSQTRDPMARVGRPDMGVWEGETMDATLTNNSAKDVYVAILDLSSDGKVSLVYPAEQGAMEVLKPGQKLSRTFTTFISGKRSSETDILKAFASYKPIDLRPLTQGTVRGGDIQPEASDPLQALLNDASGVTRGIAPVLAQPAPGEWATVERVLLVKHR